MNIGARLTIDDVEIPASWDGSALVALDDLEIPWGRDDPYTDTPPAMLSFSLIDVTGSWAASSARNGQRVAVYRTLAGQPDVRMFLGRIATITLDQTTIYNPLTAEDERVWLVQLTANDVPGELAQSVVPGPSGDQSLEGLGGWAEAKASDRGAAVWERGAKTVLDSMEQLPLNAASGVMHLMRARDSGDKLSVLQLIADIYRQTPLGYVNYDPDTNAITVGKYATQSAIVLGLVAGKIVLTAPGARIIPAATVELANGSKLTSTVADGIDTVQMPYRNYGRDPRAPQTDTLYTDPFIERSTARNSGLARRIMQIKSDAITLDKTLYGQAGWPTIDQYNAFPAWLLSQVTALVDGFNDQLRLPQLRLDFERFPITDPTTLVHLLSPKTTPVPLYFPGSIYAGFPNVGPQHQIIGGTLRFKSGWTHDLTLIAAKPRSGTPLTIGQLVTNATPTLGDFDETITLSDLGTVTQGLA